MTSDKRHLGRLKLDVEILAERIGLQPGHQIIGMREDESGRLNLIIEGSSMPETATGDLLPEVTIHFTIRTEIIQRVGAVWGHAPDLARWDVGPYFRP